MIIKEKYTPHRVEMIQRILNNEAEKGSPKDFDIRVDELKVVSRTSDPEQFHSYEDFVDKNTASVTISLYEGASRHCTRYVLLLKEEPATSEQKEETLSGIEATIEQKITEQKMKWEKELLLKEKEELEKKVSEGEEYIDKLERRVEELEEQKNSTANKFTETLVGLAGTYLQNNPNALSGIPIVGNLLNGSDRTNRQITEGDSQSSDHKMESRSEGKASFERQSELSDDEKLLQALRKFFREESMLPLATLIKHMNRNPEIIPILVSVVKDMEENGPPTKESTSTSTNPVNQ